MIWKPSIVGDLALWASRVVDDVADRLRDLQIIERAVADAKTQTAYPRSTHWIPYSVSQGYAGIALLWGYIDACFPGKGWDVTGREALQRAAHDAERGSAIPIGSFSGLAGLGMAAWQLSYNGMRYRRLLAAIDRAIVPQVLRMATAVEAQQDGVNVGDFDVISGLSGIGSYLLCRRNEATVSDALAEVIKALIELLSEREGLMRWHTPTRFLWDEESKRTYPHGNLNCGLAHGLSGVLAFLSLALSTGCIVPGLSDAVKYAAGWLAVNRCDDEWGVNWPTAVSLVEARTESGNQLIAGSANFAPGGPSRCAWCYGSPGIARSLWLAGDALNDDSWRELAITAMEAVFKRPANSQGIDSPTFCHGKAGLLQIALRFANDTGQDIFVSESQNLAREILLAYKPRSLLGFRNIETGANEIDQPGLLDGVPGVVLVLLAGSTTVTPEWDRLFLLS